MMKEFTVLTECELAKVDGGKGSKGSSYVAGFASAAIAGTGLGVGTGNLAGAFAGAHIGLVAGGLACIGGYLGSH
mgnify:CR=1 FL=1